MMADSDNPFTVSDEIREFTDKSIDHARRAFDDYVRTTREAAAGIEDQAHQFRAEARVAQEKALGHAEENVAAAMDYARALVNAGSPADLLDIQRGFLETQMKALSEQSADLAEMTKSAMSRLKPGGEQS